MMKQKLWIAYYKALWCTRCCVWNPLYFRVGKLADWLFDEADWQVRKRL